MNLTLIALAVLTILIAACAPGAPPAIGVTRQVEVTRLVTVQVGESIGATATAYAQAIAEGDLERATYIGELQATLTALAPPPGPTATPLPTTDLTKAAKGDGSYRTGPNIAPGIWQSSGSGSEECWIVINNLDGDLIDIQGNPAGSTIRIPAGDYIVVIGGGSGNLCTWRFLQP